MKCNLQWSIPFEGCFVTHNLSSGFTMHLVIKAQNIEIIFLPHFSHLVFQLNFLH